MKYTLSELIREHHEIMLGQGFHDPRLSDLELLTLIITEISEAIDAYRNQDWFRNHSRAKIKIPGGNSYQIKDLIKTRDNLMFKCAYKIHVKDTVEHELADACLRILDFMGLHGMEPPEDITFGDVRENCFGVLGKIFPEDNFFTQSSIGDLWEDYDAEIYFRNECNGTFLSLCGAVILLLSINRALQVQMHRVGGEYIMQQVIFALSCILYIAHENNIDIESHILAAMRFNRTRPKKHGKIL